MLTGWVSALLALCVPVVDTMNRYELFGLIWLLKMSSTVRYSCLLFYFCNKSTGFCVYWYNMMS